MKVNKSYLFYLLFCLFFLIEKISFCNIQDSISVIANHKKISSYIYYKKTLNLKNNALADQIIDIIITNLNQTAQINIVSDLEKYSYFKENNITFDNEIFNNYDIKTIIKALKQFQINNIIFFSFMEVQNDKFKINIEIVSNDKKKYRKLEFNFDISYSNRIAHIISDNLMDVLFNYKSYFTSYIATIKSYADYSNIVLLNKNGSFIKEYEIKSDIFYPQFDAYNPNKIFFINKSHEDTFVESIDFYTEKRFKVVIKDQHKDIIALKKVHNNVLYYTALNNDNKISLMSFDIKSNISKEIMRYDKEYIIFAINILSNGKVLYIKSSDSNRFVELFDPNALLFKKTTMFEKNFCNVIYAQNTHDYILCIQNDYTNNNQQLSLIDTVSAKIFILYNNDKILNALFYENNEILLLDKKNTNNNIKELSIINMAGNVIMKTNLGYNIIDVAIIYDK